MLPEADTLTHAEWASAHTRAASLIPGGALCHSKDDAHFPPNAPRFIQGGDGSQVWDDHGRDWLDWGMGLRSVILGHAFTPVIIAANRALRAGANHTRPTLLEGELAERLTGIIPCGRGGMAKFGKNGSDAVTAAVRLARAATGREMVMVGAGSFHASDDWWLSISERPKGTIRQATKVFPYNDAEWIGPKLLTRRYAAVVMEAMAFEWPKPGYLQAVRQWCSVTGTVLIFDEVITGFRFGLAGAQGYFGVTPDLACFGKAMANGFSVSALVGKRELMELADGAHGIHVLSSTHGGETHALAAALATIDVIDRKNVSVHLVSVGMLLQDGLRAAGYDVRGHPASPAVVFPTPHTFRPGLDHLAFVGKLCDRGILAPYWAPSFSHTEQDVQRTIAAAQA